MGTTSNLPPFQGGQGSSMSNLHNNQNLPYKMKKITRAEDLPL